MPEPTNSVSTSIPVPQCRLEEAADYKTAVNGFTRAAGHRIRAFLANKVEASEIEFNIHATDQGEVEIIMTGPIPEFLLEELGNQILSLARSRGICSCDYPPPDPTAIPEDVCDEDGVLVDNVNGVNVYLCDDIGE
jgi:hypothetical protein